MARSLLAPIVAFALVAGVAQPAAADGNAKQGHGGIFVFSGQSDPVAYTARDAAGPNAVGAPVNWLDLEPSDGVYNWSPLDDILRRAEKAHKKVSLRVYVNADGFFKATPDWFFALPGAQSYQTDFSAQQGIKLPIAWDPIFRAKFGEFLTALGHRYDGNRTIEYVQTLAGGGLYGEMVTAIGCGIGAPTPPCPPGWDEPTAISSIRYWVDRWRDAFPDTNLALMVNDLGGTLIDDAMAYAVSKKFYLESNSPVISDKTISLYNLYDGRTKIIMEIENGGCRDNTMPALKANIIDKIFGYGYSIDYLTLCSVAFTDAPTAEYIHKTLIHLIRAHGPGGV